MSLLLLLALSTAPDANCAARCSGSVKPCVEHCEKNLPKDKQDACRKACNASVQPCTDRCKNPGGEK